MAIPKECQSETKQRTYRDATQCTKLLISIKYFAAPETLGNRINHGHRCREGRRTKKDAGDYSCQEVDRCALRLLAELFATK
jgi:hypothetical protein